ncbi:LOW QUALITY PROTEIN: myelin protein zero-like protein 1 [Dugong dugon]
MENASQALLLASACTHRLIQRAGCRPVTAGVSALEVYTPKEIFVANGTQGKLTCKFKYPDRTSSLTSVSWRFSQRGWTSLSFFHYSQGQEYLGDYLPFKGRIRWAGDLDKKDTSINIENMHFIHGNYICDVRPSPDIVVQPEHIRFHVVGKESLPMFPVWVVVGIVSAVVLGLTLLISMILAVLYRKNSKQDYTGESLSLVKQAPQKSSSNTEGLVKSLPSGSHQSRVQLDHSGRHHSDRINKLESVVYADIRKN